MLRRLRYRSSSRPSRAATATASPRVRTSSLRRIADTWWSTVRRETKRRSAISALRRPLARSRGPRAPGPVKCPALAVVERRGPRATPRTPRSRNRRATIRASGPAPSRWSSARDFAQWLLVVRLGQRQRRLVRAVASAPCVGGAAPVSPELERPRPGHRRRYDVFDPVLPAPVRELADPPRRRRLLRRLPYDRRLVANTVEAPLEPRHLGTHAGE